MDTLIEKESRPPLSPVDDDPLGLPAEPWGQSLLLHPGLEFHCMEFNTPRSVALDFPSHGPFLEFGCLLSGRICGCTRFGNGLRRPFEGRPGQTWCSFQPTSHSTIEYRSGQPICIVGFLVSGPLLKHFPFCRPGENALVEKGPGEGFFNITGHLNPTVRQVVQQILRIHERAEVSDQLLLLSKAYELLFHLSQGVHDSGEDAHARAKRQGARRAQEILNRNLASPPPLADIARLSGVCVTNLTEEFKKQFGTTVFGYLRRQRLARAKELITLDGMSASEAAWEVGYSSLSSFHRAFCSRYGATPGSYSRKG